MINYVEEKTLGNWEDVKKFVWGGAKDTIKIIEEVGKETEALIMIETVFEEAEYITDISINDYIWFDLLDDLEIDY